MIDLEKEREVVHNAVNTLFDIAKVLKAEIDLLNVDIANKQAEIDELKAKLEKAQAVPEGFVVVPKEPTQELLNKMQDNFVGAFENGLTGGQAIHCAYIAMIEAAQGEEE